MRRRTQLALAALVCVYTIAALSIDAERAAPLVVFELLLLAYVALYKFCGVLKRHRRGVVQLSCVALDRPAKRAAALIAMIALHVAVLLALGAWSAERWIPVLGLALIVAGCYAASTQRRSVRWRPVCAGLLVQFWLGVLLLRTRAGRAAVQATACGVSSLLSHAAAGASFLFGRELVSTVWAFKVLPITLFFASLCSVLLHLGVLQLFFGHVGAALSALLGVSRAESICAVANMFLGQTEAPLLVRPLLPALNAAQLHCVMVCGFGSVAGSTLGAYMLMGAPPTHLLCATVMNAPGAIAIAKLLHPDAPPQKLQRGGRGPAGSACACGVAVELSASLPPPDPSAVEAVDGAGAAGAGCAADPSRSPPRSAEAGEPPSASDGSEGRSDIEAVMLHAGGGADCETDGSGDADVMPPSQSSNLVGAAADGAISAIQLVSCIAATLLAFLALISLLDAIVGWLGSLLGVRGVSFTLLLGYAAWPAAYLMGVPPRDCADVGQLLGAKTAANEFVAYGRLTNLMRSGLSARASVLATYALCGFANFGSMGIMVGGLSSMAPRSRAVLSAQVLRAMIGGTLVCYATACVAGMLYDEAEADAADGSSALALASCATPFH